MLTLQMRILNVTSKYWNYGSNPGLSDWSAHACSTELPGLFTICALFGSTLFLTLQHPRKKKLLYISGHGKTILDSDFW